MTLFCALALAGCGGTGDGSGDGSDGGSETSVGGGDDDDATGDDDDDADTPGDDDDDATGDDATGDDDDDATGDDDTTGSDDDDDDSTGDDDDDDDTPGDPSTALHVSELGQDSNPGTPDEPMRTIQWALDQAAMNDEIESIRVAGGTYQADVANDAVIVMLDGVSMYGGWSEDFSERDPATWTSTIVDSSEVEPPSVDGEPARVVEIPVSVGETTVLDGFRIEVGLGLFRSALYIEGDATVTGNEIVPGGLTDAVVASAIHVEFGSPRIGGNRIALDYDDEVSFLRTIAIDGATPVVANNVITADGGSSGRYVMWLSNAGGSIVGNSMVLTEGFNATMIRLQVDSAPAIENNLMQAGGSTGGICISSLTSGSVPPSLRSNLLQCGFVVQANGESPLSTWTSIADLHAGMADAASGNVKLAAPLVDAEHGLDDATPCTVARGGLDLTADYPEDFVGETRTDPVSMGALEWDGDCQ